VHKSPFEVARAISAFAVFLITFHHLVQGTLCKA